MTFASHGRVRAPRLARFFVLLAATASCTTFGSGAPDGDGGGADAAVIASDATVVPSDAAADVTVVPDAGAAGGCLGSAAGTSLPCDGCPVETYQTVQTNAAPETGPYVSGVAVDAKSLYWLEQVGGDPYNGQGFKTYLYRRSLLTGQVELLAVRAEPFTSVTSSGDYLWIASGSSNRTVQRFQKNTCVPNACPSAPFGSPVTATAVVATDTGIALLAGSRMVVYANNGSVTDVEATPGAKSLAKLGDDWVYASETNATRTILVHEADLPVPLLTSEPDGGTRQPRGASKLASSCAGLWALQTFEEQGSATSGALVRTMIKGPARGALASNPLTFAFVGDATHAYAGHPNGGGITRYGTDGRTRLLAPSRSVWHLAIDDTHVYFDSHGPNGAKSEGIMRIQKRK